MNDGERAMTKLWNKHMLRNRGQYFGKCHIYPQALAFVQLYGEEILKNNLKNNCKLHMFTLHFFGILKAVEVEECCHVLNEIDRRWRERNNVQEA